ncbi:MAG: sigma-54-dependent Fis family transcriptional regulator [Burkholderiales bacterium]|nr:sigma-54-dependent Fis family transcriptional regulator [Burkholderiales bacterium]
MLVVDDEQRSQDAIRRTLDEDFRVITASSADEARERLLQQPVSVILCDQRMPGVTGVEFLAEVRERWPDVVRIVVSGYTDADDIIDGINSAGIYRFVLKPWAPDHLIGVVRDAVDTQGAHQDLQRLDRELRAGAPVLRRKNAERLRQAQSAFGFDRIERAPGGPLDAVCEMAARFARYDLSVLVQGESGTGKELLARAIHFASPRAGGPFVVENCAAIPDTLLESELFGHKRGAFTGAFEDHVGVFQRAHGGTVFLDEVGETSPAFQVRLLRVLQEGELRPVGSTRAVPVDVRVIAATHRTLEDEVRAGRFREDLYYRLAGVTLTMPPLRERIADVLPIARRLLTEVCTQFGLPPQRLADDALKALMGHAWPGNIRELRNELARAVALSAGEPGVAVVRAAAFSRQVLHGAGSPMRAVESGAGLPAALPAVGTLAQRLDAMEAAILREALLRAQWNKSQVARELGLSRGGLAAKLVRHGLREGRS